MQPPNQSSLQSVVADLSAGVTVPSYLLYRLRKMTKRYAALLLVLLGSVALSHAYQNQLTQPRLWPRPTHQKIATQQIFVDRCQFLFQFDDNRNEVAQAVAIYRSIVLRADSNTVLCNSSSPSNGTIPYVVRVLIETAATNQSQEAYNLTINTVGRVGSASLRARSYIGLLRALETLSQLIQEESTGTPSSRLVLPASVLIQDSPAFSHRGILLDTARNFIPIPTLQRVIDAMMYVSKPTPPL